MAYTPNNLSVIAQTIEGTFNEFYYTGTDTTAQVIAANYISDGQKRGLSLGDLLWYWNSGSNVLTQMFVSAQQTLANGLFGVTLSVSGAGTGTGVPQVNTAVTATVGTTLAGAAIVGGQITRTGPTAAFTDTTDTAANIIAAMNSQTIGNAWHLVIVNDTAFAETLAAGSGVTLSGETIVPANSSLELLVTYSAAGTITMYGIEAGLLTALQPIKWSTAALSVGTLATGAITGGDITVLTNTGATPGAQTVRTAAQMLADIPGAQAGDSFMFRIVNTGAGTLTLTADGGATVTITGTATIATNIFRDYVLTFNTATTATIQSIGSGVSP